jgi:hypothetical protein
MLSRVFPRHQYQRYESEGFPVLTTVQSVSYTVNLDSKVVDSMYGYGMV